MPATRRNKFSAALINIYNLLIYFTTTSRLAKELMKTCHNKAKLRQKSDNDTKIEDVLPFPFMTYKVNHEM